MRYAHLDLVVVLESLSNDGLGREWSAAFCVSTTGTADQHRSVRKVFSFMASDRLVAERMAAQACNRWLEENGGLP